MYVSRPELKVIRNSVSLSGNPNNLPHIYNFEKVSNSNVLLPGQKLALPANTERMDTSTYELFKIPFGDIEAAKAKFQVNIRGIEQNFPNRFWPCFQGYDNLNRMQSLVYPSNYYIVY